MREARHNAIFHIKYSMCNSNQYANSSTRFNYGAAKWPLPPPMPGLSWWWFVLFRFNPWTIHVVGDDVIQVLYSVYRHSGMHSKEGESGLARPGQGNGWLWMKEWLTENGDKLLFVSCVVATYLRFVVCFVLILQEPHFSFTRRRGLAWLGLDFIISTSYIQTEEQIRAALSIIIIST